MAVALALLQLPSLDIVVADDCHCSFLPHVLITAKLLESLLQLTEEAVDICWVCPDFWSVAYHVLSFISKESTILCPTPYPNLASSFSLVSMRLHAELRSA